VADPQLTIEEAAERLGKPVSTVRRWVSSGRLSGKKIGRQWLVDASAVPQPVPVAGVVARSPSAPTTVDLDASLTQLEYRDLRALWVPDVLAYEDALSDRVSVLASAATKLAAPGPFEPVTIIEIPKTAFSTRPGSDFALDDRLAYHGAVAALAPRIERLLSDSVYSARLSSNNRYLNLNGRDQWLRWRRETVRLIGSGYKWMVKTDISSYFDNIEHRLLFADIDRVSPDRSISNALKRMLGEWAPVTARGIPQGPDASRTLGNLYLIPVDEQMVVGDWKYLRYLDDIHVLGRSRREVIEGVRSLERECRRRGLVLAGHKTQLLVGAEAVASLTESELDDAQYWLDLGVDPLARHDLRKILRGSLAKAGALNTRHALFSLYRLRILRDHLMTRLVIRNIEQLAPVASAMAGYLYPFLGRPVVEDGLLSFFRDSERNTSAYVSAWLLAAYLDRGDRVPNGVVTYAAVICRDRNQPTYHRVMAANVMAIGRRPSDIAWLIANAKAEFDPALVRGYVVALTRVSQLTKSVETTVSARAPRMTTTLKYLKGRRNLPSLIFRDYRAPIL
jgi:excisionase family DNA binding protein